MPTSRKIAQWNLARLAETLLDLINPGRQRRRRASGYQ
jgi:uncharacterized protein YdiU (UPF0061 family)